MGVFSRLSDILAANLHALLDRAEDPERMIAHVIRTMEDGVARAARYAASAIAAERQLTREMKRNQREAERWQEQAAQALLAGREDLARQALERKVEHAKLARALEGQRAAARQTSDEVRDVLRLLETRLAEARHKQGALVARHQAAKARRELITLAEGIPDPSTAQATLRRLEHRLLAFEDEVMARCEIYQVGTALEQEIDDLETEREVSRQLQALKQAFDRGPTHPAEPESNP
jgi:phage shock protein A